MSERIEFQTDYVLGRIAGEGTLFLFSTDQQAAAWALYPSAGVKRLWAVKLKVGDELLPVAPGPPSLRVADRTSLINPVDTAEGPA